MESFFITMFAGGPELPITALAYSSNKSLQPNAQVFSDRTQLAVALAKAGVEHLQIEHALYLIRNSPKALLKVSEKQALDFAEGHYER